MEGGVISALNVSTENLLSTLNHNITTVHDVTQTVMAAIGVDVASVEGNTSGAREQNAVPVLSQSLGWKSRSVTIEEACKTVLAVETKEHNVRIEAVYSQTQIYIK